MITVRGGEVGQVLSHDEQGNPIWIWNWSSELEDIELDSTIEDTDSEGME